MATSAVLATVGLVSAGNPAALAFLPSTAYPVTTSSTPRTLPGSRRVERRGKCSSKLWCWKKAPCYGDGTATTATTVYSRSFKNDFATTSRGRQVLGVKMAVSSEEHHSVATSDGSEQTAGSQGYRMPIEASIELVRLELAEVPVDRVQHFLRKWASRRVKTDNQGWRGPIRLAGPRYGVPETISMPVSSTRSHLGVTLSFDGSPTDVIKLEALYLRGGGTCVMVTRGVDGLAKLGGMGPQIAALVRYSEDEIKAKLEVDLKEFAQEYHERVLKGLAPAADRGGVGGEGTGGYEEEDRATVLPDGTIDVTPREKPRAKAPAPWEDGSAPPPIPRMEDFGKEAEIPIKKPSEVNGEAGTLDAEMEVPDLKALFGDGDTKKFDKEAFKLFETMEKGRKGQEEVVGDDQGEGFDGFFAKLRANGTASESELVTLFEAGKNASKRGGPDQSSIPVQTDLAQLEVMIGGNTGLRGGIDIFAGPPRPIGGRVGETTDQSQSGGDEGGERGAPGSGTYTMFDEDGDPVLELTADEMDALDEDKLMEVMASVDVLIGELVERPRDMWNSIVSEYTDLYLNPFYIISMRARIPKASEEEREAMQAVNQMAVNTVQQLADMHRRLEKQQLEKIRDICEAALEDMESLPDKIRHMKPLLDDNFVAYMGYAIQKEREEIAKSGMDPDREPTRWLQVLGVIQKGVLAELSKAIYKDVEAISHVLKLREPEERFTLLNYTVSTLPSMYVRGFKKTATNIIDYYRTQGDACHDQEMRSMILEMGEALEVLMSEERMSVLCKEVDEWAAMKAKEDSMESKMRRLREYEAEELEMRRKTASGLWNSNMHPDATMDSEEKAEINKLTDAIRAQNILEGGVGTKAQLMDGKQVNDASGGGDDVGDQGADDNEAELRRKLRRLTGPGGALESEARRSPDLFSPKGALAETADAARKATNAAELERIAAEGVDDLSEVFSRASEVAGASKGGTAESELRDRGQTEGGSVDDDDWGSFDEEDLRGRGGSDGRHGGKSTKVLEPRGARIGEEVPGLLGGTRFGREEEEGEGRGDGAVEGAMSDPR